MNEEYNSGIKPWQWAVSIIVVLILLGLGVYMMSVNSNTDGLSPVDQVGMDDNRSHVGTDRIVVTDQFPGNIVYLSTVELTHDGFVTIHKGVAGNPGDVIGYQYFEAGTQPGSIDLSERTVDGATYYAVLRTDDGDMLFDVTKDMEVTDANGEVVMETFRATTDLPEDKG